MNKTWSVPVFLLLAGVAHAQGCKVVDPELQAYYAGPCVNGLAEGRGIAEGTAHYEGKFRAGKKEGRGVKTWPNGDRYEGDFADDRKDGRGVYVFGRGPWAGERYEGEFSNDRRHGTGTYRWANGDVYTGPWENDAFTGEPTPMMFAHAKFTEEAMAASGKPGTRVCREVEVGIGGRDWVRGIVQQAEGDKIAVRIDDPGKMPYLIGGVEARPGATVRESPSAWVPCW
jgi:hypothetical protein